MLFFPKIFNPNCTRTEIKTAFNFCTRIEMKVFLAESIIKKRKEYADKGFH